MSEECLQNAFAGPLDERDIDFGAAVVEIPGKAVSGLIDLLVLGGGMAGLAAAARAAELGAHVTLVEADTELGGSGRWAGFLWTAENESVFAEINPLGDPAMRSALVQDIGRARSWLRGHDVAIGGEIPGLRIGRGTMMDTTGFIRTSARLITARGGEIMLGSRASELIRDGEAVVGAEIDTPKGRQAIRASTTLIATGGFQGDPAALGDAIHPNAVTMPLRSSRTSVGDGARMAQAVGAAFGADHAGFYGHLVVAGVPLNDPRMFTDVTLYYSEHSLIFNREGERFVDETIGDHITAMAAVEQTDNRVLVVADQRVRDQWMLGQYVQGAPVVDRFDLCLRRGGRCAVAESLDEFADIPADWGFPGERIRDAIRQVNDEAAAGRTSTPARRFDPAPLVDPPYYVVEGTAAITFTMAGIRTDSVGRVQSVEGGAIPGLLAAGSDVGGLYVRAYAGGLAPAIVFGLRAGETVASTLKSPSAEGIRT